MVTQTTMSNQQNDSSKDSGASSSREKKKRGLSLSSLKSPFKFLGKTYCKGCHKKCSGEVLRVGDLYFHNGCFNCKGCSTSLSQGYIDFTPYTDKSYRLSSERNQRMAQSFGVCHLKPSLVVLINKR